MCLESVDKIKVQNKIKNTFPEGEFVVYKLVEVKSNGYYPSFRASFGKYKEGMNSAHIIGVIFINNDMYIPGFHFWITKKAAEKNKEHMEKYAYSDEKYVVIECKIKKEWITTTGQNDTSCDQPARAIVTDKAIFPAYKEDK